MSSTRDPDVTIAAVAGRQHGVFTRRQALDAGHTPTTIRNRLHRGLWERLDPGVYRLHGWGGGWKGVVMAAVLAEPHAVVSGRAAAHLHGFVGFGPCRPVITVPRGANHRSRLAAVRRSPHVEATAVDGIPCTTIRQTVVDLAGTTATGRLPSAVDELLTERRLSLTALEQRILELAPIRPSGIAELHRLLERYDDGATVPASVLEGLLHGMLRRLGIQGWIAQADAPWRDLGVDAGGDERVDVLVPWARTIIEADGRRWHRRWADFENDRRRDNLAARAGHRVLRLTVAMLRDDEDATGQLVLDTLGGRRPTAPVAQ